MNSRMMLVGGMAAISDGLSTLTGSIKRIKAWAFYRQGLLL